jgi:hypothetical protein
MNVPFEHLNPNSKIWIYQSNRKLNSEEQKFILENTQRFLDEWTAHGNDLQAGVKISYDQFIIIGVNEAINEASGCSIDTSVNYIRELGKALNVNLLERSKVAVKNQANIDLVDFSEIREMIGQGHITSSSMVFNNAIVSKAELENEWLLPVQKSWMKKYFN